VADPRPSVRVLFAEDARDFRELMRDELRDRGFMVTAVEDGLRAVETFRWSAFDVVLTDLAMPGLNGLQVAKACKQHRPGVKVVVLTGWDLLLEDEECIEHGVDMVIAKPVQINVLTAALRQVVHEPAPFQRSAGILK
jgi:CheY-like chemotaxis protein